MKFFDRVNHDILMARVARKLKDKRVLKLIRAAGKTVKSTFRQHLLDDFHKELDKRGHKFVRYVDDCNIYVRS